MITCIRNIHIFFKDKHEYFYISLLTPFQLFLESLEDGLGLDSFCTAVAIIFVSTGSVLWVSISTLDALPFVLLIRFDFFGAGLENGQKMKYFSWILKLTMFGENGNSVGWYRSWYKFHTTVYTGNISCPFSFS